MEFKETNNRSANNRSFLKTVSAYANYGDGEILFGVNDQGNIVGIKDIDNFKLAIENEVNDNIEPVPDFIIEVNNQIVKLKVFEGEDKPYFYNSKAYVRKDTSTVEVDKISLKRLIMEGDNISYDSIPSTKKDISLNYLENELKEKMKISKLSDDVLLTLKTIYHEIVKGARRENVELIPENAFRETVANALADRTWDIKSNIIVEMNDENIIVTSPGGLSKGITEKEYLTEKISILRNPIIADVFYRLDIIEKFGTDVHRILSEYSNSVKKPQFLFSENFVRVILPLIEKDTSKLTDDEKIIYSIPLL